MRLPQRADRPGARLQRITVSGAEPWCCINVDTLRWVMFVPRRSPGELSGIRRQADDRMQTGGESEQHLAKAAKIEASCRNRHRVT